LYKWLTSKPFRPTRLLSLRQKTKPSGRRVTMCAYKFFTTSRVSLSTPKSTSKSQTPLFPHTSHLTAYILTLRVPRYDDTAIHFLLRLIPSLTPIGTIRTFKRKDADHSYVYYKLSRLAVLKNYRQHKFGRDLVLALHDWVINSESKGITIGRDLSSSSSPSISGQASDPVPGRYVEVVSHSQIPVKGFYAK
jgi:hypothetical protein